MRASATAVLIAGVMVGVGGRAEAQGPSTCSFDGATATVTVAVDGHTARVQAIAATGEIRLNGVACGGATVSNTDAIQVNGGALADVATLTGTFAPGLTPETDGASEIEVSFALGAGSDTVTVNLTSGADRVNFTGGGIDVGDDLDQDIGLAGTEVVEVDGREGNDIIDGAAYTGTPAGGALDLYGGAGDDRLVGNDSVNHLFGDDGRDTLYGRGGNDELAGGFGDDSMYGGAGNDYLLSEATTDGSDLMRGGDGADRAFYSGRTIALFVSLGNGLADDGEPGEGDRIELDVEHLTSGDGDDVLVGSNRKNSIFGMAGDDEIHGGLGNDFLNGGGGADVVFGDDGDDGVNGDGGNDVLTGGAGSDTFGANDGNDTIYNADGFADWVSCGAGTDDAEPDPLDTFFGCEL